MADAVGTAVGAATAPALVVVGVMMITPVKEIDYDDFTEAIPAFLTMVVMICASSMARAWARILSSEFCARLPAVLACGFAPDGARTGVRGRVVPHPVQNTLPSGLSLPHDGHFIFSFPFPIVQLSN